MSGIRKGLGIVAAGLVAVCGVLATPEAGVAQRAGIQATATILPAPELPVVRVDDAGLEQGDRSLVVEADRRWSVRVELKGSEYFVTRGADGADRSIPLAIPATAAVDRARRPAGSQAVSTRSGEGRATPVRITVAVN